MYGYEEIVEHFVHIPFIMTLEAADLFHYYYSLARYPTFCMCIHMPLIIRHRTPIFIEPCIIDFNPFL